MHNEDVKDLRRIGDLVHGDETPEWGTVSHREGRKVWFSDRIVTFASLDEEVEVVAAS